MNKRQVNGNLVVVALGGNAISRSHEEGNVDQQFANSRETARQLADLVVEGFQLVITHGNGPQIGNFLLRNEAGASLIYPLPMEVAVAHVQGGMGFMIAQTLMNELSDRGRDIVIPTIVTTVLVDENDPAFAHPSKPIGQTIIREQADRLAHAEGWRFKEVTPGGFRRVVPSPPALRIMEIDILRRAVSSGDIVVACGGGGVPVVRRSNGHLAGVRAVIDKDLASALLAEQLSASMILFLTAVDRVSIDFGKPSQRPVDRMTVRQARSWLDEGQFPPGSMGPKVLGALQFLEAAPGGVAVIGSLEKAADAARGLSGTRITTD